jgi:hypothetical protein
VLPYSRKENPTPWQIIQRLAPRAPLQLCLLSPVFLDYYLKDDGDTMCLGFADFGDTFSLSTENPADGFAFVCGCIFSVIAKLECLHCAK